MTQVWRADLTQSHDDVDEWSSRNRIQSKYVKQSTRDTLHRQLKNLDGQLPDLVVNKLKNGNNIENQR